MHTHLDLNQANCLLCASFWAGLYDLKMTTRGEMEMAYYGVSPAGPCLGICALPSAEFVRLREGQSTHGCAAVPPPASRICASHLLHPIPRVCSVYCRR
jgi:hypothetical protein